MKEKYALHVQIAVAHNNPSDERRMHDGNWKTIMSYISKLFEAVLDPSQPHYHLIRDQIMTLSIAEV
jgi:hypothetical protein